jgi:hypothetical protein
MVGCASCIRLLTNCKALRWKFGVNGLDGGPEIGNVGILVSWMQADSMKVYPGKRKKGKRKKAPQACGDAEPPLAFAPKSAKVPLP